MKAKKVAIVADMMMGVGGAEVVVLKVLEMFPGADFYTLFISPGALKKIEEKFPKLRVRTSFFQRFIKSDRVSKYISIIKIISWIYWEILDLSNYDLVLSLSHSFMAKNVKRGKEAKHISYIHTPPRFLYGEFNEIYWIKNKPWKWLFWPIKKGLIYIDKKGSKRPDIMVANSKNVARRIKKYYGREARVIYPPVEVLKVMKNYNKKEYFVCLSRLVKQKGIELAVKVCSEKKIPLIVIGSGEELIRLKKLAGKSVRFVENCGDKLKFKILTKALALIYTSKEEDFGIVPVEALKVGTPVIAYKSGGVLETVVDGVNGVFYNNFDKKDLEEATRRLMKLKIDSKTCIKSVEKFSSKNFVKEMRRVIDEAQA
jgi:glycosyltransferase involved in cell wall biosynthesis